MSYSGLFAREWRFLALHRQGTLYSQTSAMISASVLLYFVLCFRTSAMSSLYQNTVGKIPRLFFRKLFDYEQMNS